MSVISAIPIIDLVIVMVPISAGIYVLDKHYRY